MPYGITSQILEIDKHQLIPNRFRITQYLFDEQVGMVWMQRTEIKLICRNDILNDSNL